VLEEAACLAEDRTELELDGFKMDVNPLAAGSLYCAEQSIGPSFIFFNFGHNGMSTCFMLVLIGRPPSAEAFAPRRCPASSECGPDALATSNAYMRQMFLEALAACKHIGSVARARTRAVVMGCLRGLADRYFSLNYVF